MHLMHVPFVPMHSRDMGRPFDPMNRGGMERGGQPYPPFPGRDGGRVSGGSGLYIAYNVLILCIFRVLESAPIEF